MQSYNIVNNIQSEEISNNILSNISADKEFFNHRKVCKLWNDILKNYKFKKEYYTNLDSVAKMEFMKNHCKLDKYQMLKNYCRYNLYDDIEYFLHNNEGWNESYPLYSEEDEIIRNATEYCYSLGNIETGLIIQKNSHLFEIKQQFGIFIGRGFNMMKPPASTLIIYYASCNIINKMVSLIRKYHDNPIVKRHTRQYQYTKEISPQLFANLIIEFQQNYSLSSSILHRIRYCVRVQLSIFEEALCENMTDLAKDMFKLYKKANKILLI